MGDDKFLDKKADFNKSFAMVLWEKTVSPKKIRIKNRIMKCIWAWRSNTAEIQLLW